MSHGDRRTLPAPRAIAPVREALEDAGDALERAALATLNPVFYRLRTTLRFRRAGYHESPVRGAHLPPTLVLWVDGDRARSLEERYDVTPFHARLHRGSYALVLLRLDLLDLVAECAEDLAAPHAARTLRVLDVGAKNFDSAVALERFFRARVAPPSLTGIEIDAFRVYRGFHSRADVAQYYLSLLPPATPPHRYLPGDVLTHDERYDVVTWFKPFLTAGPLLRWGLPRSLLKPEALLAHVADRLVEGGRLLIVNQDEHEADAQESLLAGHGELRWRRVDLAAAAMRVDDRAYAFVAVRS